MDAREHTKEAFTEPFTTNPCAPSHHREERLQKSLKVKRVVARDGIEPPTPAFSGPRSTTELSGLGKSLSIAKAIEAPRLPRIGLGTQTSVSQPVDGKSFR